MTAIFRDDFEGHFRSIYEDTVNLLDAFPGESESEVFNAFEHFSLACKLAAEVDGSATPAADVEAVKDKARVNLGQARRHLSVGRFFCIEHQIIFTMYSIRDHVARLPDNVRAAKAIHQGRADELESEFRGAAAIEIKPIYNAAELERAVNEFENEIDGLTRVLNGFLKLADDILAPNEPQTPAQA